MCFDIILPSSGIFSQVQLHYSTIQSWFFSIVEIIELICRYFLPHSSELQKGPHVLLFGSLFASERNVSGLFFIPQWQIEHRKINEFIFSFALIIYGLHILPCGARGTVVS